MTAQHKELGEGRWLQLSFLEQMGNIGSEIERALLWQEKDPERFMGAITRSLELIDFTIGDVRNVKRLKEIARARELLCDAAFGDNTYQTSLYDLDRYFFYFALAARYRR